MYGDTHVDPAPLFDPDRGRPPARRRVGPVLPRPDQPVAARRRLRRPRHGPRARPAARPLRRPGRRHIRDVQRQGGYVTGGHRGRAVPARLEITALAENQPSPASRRCGCTPTSTSAAPRSRSTPASATRSTSSRAAATRPTSHGAATSTGWSTPDDRRPRVGLGAAARPHLGRSSRSSTRRWPSTSPATGSGSARASTARASRSWPTRAGVPASRESARIIAARASRRRTG